MDEIIEGAKFVEIDKSRKYIIMLSGLSEENAVKIVEMMDTWLDSDKPVAVLLQGDNIKLLEVEENED